MKRGVAQSLKGFWAIWGDDRGLTALLVLLLLDFFVVPLLGLGLARVLGTFGFSLVLLTGAANLSRNRVVRGFTGVVVVLALLLQWLDQISPEPTVTVAKTAASLLFLILLTVQILLRVFRAGPVTSHRIRGAVAAYFLFGVCWALLYALIELSLPAAFSFPAAEAASSWHVPRHVYFSFVTLTTLGYGDITAVHPIARMFVILEALVGQLYPATLLARLVTLEIMYRDKLPMEKSPGGGE